ncbi:unnamed protein product [Arctia plantaginis]|uniref:Uncharacterized protein n=1 Tax=Arctia plantaginis TaxID=874455 RepID=A0A8S1B7Z4_ARCPL|nr:unnamed protein product [Arctia plantaginis]
MLIFKCGLIILTSTYIVSLCFQVSQEISSLDTGLAFLYIASGAIAGKIIYDRYQQIHILGSLTINPNVTSFANRIASFSASFFSMGFLVYFLLFLLKVDSNCLTALNIFVCGFGTLYIWMQCIITTYISTLYYDKKLTVFRQCLANVSFLILIVMAIFGTVTSFLPISGSSGIYICFVITSLCSNLLAAIFCVFILSFEKEYEYFAEGLRSELLLDDDCSLNNATLSDVDSIFGAQESISSTIVIKGNISCDLVEDNDSGMSSEETDDSLKVNIRSIINDNVSSSVDDKQEVITKCLTIEPHCAEHRNEIPSCSKAVNVSVFIDKADARSHLRNPDNLIIDNRVSDFFVIDLTCDVAGVHASSKPKGERSKKTVGTKDYKVDRDYSSIANVESSQCLVPVVNNELANTENQKLLSLSLSILLAALLQAMRCFAQFLEDIVVPQR